MIDPYSNLILKMVADAYPSLQPKGEMLIDILSDSIFGTKNVRFGPLPSIESQYAIREYVRNQVNNDSCINFVVPWGSEKPDGRGPDLAELSALKMLQCLQERIKRHYAFGPFFSIRVEDASAPYLFYERPDVAAEQALAYSYDFEVMVEALGLKGFVHVARETHKIGAHAFAAEADKYLPLFEEWVSEMDLPEVPHVSDVKRKLVELGWNPDLPREARDYYYGQYDKLYPGIGRKRKIHILARYMVSAFIRKQLGLRGDHPTWKGSFLELSFAQPTPGTETFFGRRIHYRTVPSVMTSNHIAPWRAKGYAVIENGNQAIIKLASYNNLPRDLNEFQLKFGSDGDRQAIVQADYVVA